MGLNSKQTNLNFQNWKFTDQCQSIWQGSNTWRFRANNFGLDHFFKLSYTLSFPKKEKVFNKKYPFMTSSVTYMYIKCENWVFLASMFVVFLCTRCGDVNICLLTLWIFRITTFFWSFNTLHSFLWLHFHVQYFHFQNVFCILIPFNFSWFMPLSLA